MSNDILQIAMTSYYDRTKYAAIPEGMKAAINAVLPIQEHYFVEKYYNVIFSDDNNIVNELRNYLEDRDIQINRIDEDNKRLLKENEKLREVIKDINGMLEISCETLERPNYDSLEVGQRHNPLSQKEIIQRLTETCSFVRADLSKLMDEARAAIEGVKEPQQSGAGND